MACSNCKCNPKKDAVPQDGGVPGTTGNGDIDLSKYTHIEQASFPFWDDWAIQDLRDQGYTVTEPAGSTGE